MLPDDLEAWNEALGDALRTCDVVVTTGGASCRKGGLRQKGARGGAEVQSSAVRAITHEAGQAHDLRYVGFTLVSDDVEGEKRWAFALPGNPVGAHDRVVT